MMGIFALFFYLMRDNFACPDSVRPDFERALRAVAVTLSFSFQLNDIAGRS